MTDNPNKSKWDFDRILNRLLVVVAVGVLGHLTYALYANNLDELRSLMSFNPVWMIVAYLTMISTWLVNGTELLTWSNLFGKKLRFHDSIKIAMATDLGAAVVPNFIGGSPIKGSMLIKKGFSTAETATVLAMNPFSEAIFFIWFIPTSIFLGRARYDSDWILDHFSNSTVLRPMGIFVAVVVVFFMARWLWKRSKGRFPSTSQGNRIVSIFSRIGDTMSFIAREGKWHFLLVVALISIRRLLRFAALVALVKALGVEADLLVVFLFQWMVYIFMMFFPSPGASGGAEFVFHTVFKSVIPLIDITMMGWRFLTYYIMMITAALYLLFIRWRSGKII